MVLCGNIILHDLDSLFLFIFQLCEKYYTLSQDEDYRSAIGDYADEYLSLQLLFCILSESAARSCKRPGGRTAGPAGTQGAGL